MSDKTNLTKTTIANIPLPPAGKRVRIYDSKVRGLLIDVTAAGVRTFYVRRKIQGVTKWFRLGAFPDMSVEQARAEAERFNSSLAHGDDLTQTRRRAKEEMTLRDLFNEYIERHGKVHTKTWEEMCKEFDRNASSLANRRLSAISYRDAGTLQAKLRRENGLYVANRTVQLLRAVYNKGKKWRLYEGENPFHGLDLYEEKKRKRFLSNDEVGRLLHIAEDLRDVNGAIHDFVKLSLFTGVRKENLLSMRWEHLNIAMRTWTIPGSETKNSESQVIVLHDAEIEILERRLRDQKAANLISPYVFEGTGKTKHLTDPKRSWKTIREKAGIEDCTIHDLRRTLGSALADHNFNLPVIKHALNHKDIKTTASVYANVNDEAAASARAVVQSTWNEAKTTAQKQPKIKRLSDAQ